MAARRARRPPCGTPPNASSGREGPLRAQTWCGQATNVITRVPRPEHQSISSTLPMACDQSLACQRAERSGWRRATSEAPTAPARQSLNASTGTTRLTLLSVQLDPKPIISSADAEHAAPDRPQSGDDDAAELVDGSGLARRQSLAQTHTHTHDACKRRGVMDCRVYESLGELQYEYGLVRDAAVSGGGGGGTRETRSLAETHHPNQPPTFHRLSSPSISGSHRDDQLSMGNCRTTPPTLRLSRYVTLTAKPHLSALSPHPYC